MSRVRDLVEQDSWEPTDLTGHAGKVPVVNAGETGYVLEHPRIVDIPSGVNITGNILGLEYGYTSASTITVQPGTCWDSLNTTILTGAASQVVTIPSVAETIYHLFIVADGSVKTDTLVGGGNIVQEKRWIGFVLTDVSGDIVPFTYVYGTIHNSGVGFVFASQVISTSYTQSDLSGILPLTRCGVIRVGITNANDNTLIYLSEDGSTAKEYGTLNGLDTTNLSRYGAEFFKDGWWFKASAGTNDAGDICVREVKLIR